MTFAILKSPNFDFFLVNEKKKHKQKFTLVTTTSFCGSNYTMANDLSPLAIDLIENGHFTNCTFQQLWDKQRNSRWGESFQQLGLDGSGYICLRHSVDMTTEVREDFVTLLQGSNNKVFKTPNDQSRDPSRLQVTTTAGNTLDELKKINNALTDEVNLT